VILFLQGRFQTHIQPLRFHIKFREIDNPIDQTDQRPAVNPLYFVRPKLLLTELHGNSGNDKLYGKDDDDKLYGGSGKDELYGGKDDDKLDGGSSGDLLQGGTGKDIMTGGTGADTFVFKKTSESKASASRADIIEDFKDGVDKINLKAIDASTELSGNNKFTFDDTKSFGESKKGDIYYKQFDKSGKKNDYTMIYIDTDDDRDAEMSIRLTGLYDLSADDFIL
jgi:serralysin